MKCIFELKRLIVNLDQRGRISQEDVVSILLKIRQLFEQERQYQNRYPIVNLFCNWVIHTTLKHSNTIYSFLLEVSKSISTAIHLPKGEDPQEATRLFIKIAGNVLQIPNLRKGIKEIFNEQGLDTFLTDRKEWWDAFVTLLLKDISGKPLEFPKEVVEGKKEIKDATKYFTEIRALPHINDWDKVIRLEVFEKSNKYHIKLESMGHAHYVVKLMGNESEDEFAS